MINKTETEKISIAKEEFRYRFLMDIITNANDELKELEQKYRIVSDLANQSFLRIISIPEQYIKQDDSLTYAEEDEIIEEIQADLNDRVDCLARW